MNTVNNTALFLTVNVRCGGQWFLLLAALMLFCSPLLLSQEPEKKEAAKKDVDLQNVQSPKSAEPLPKIDLPEFIITGNEKIDLNIESKTEDDQERIFSPSRPTPGERPLNVGEALTPKQIKSFTKVPGALNGRVFAGFGFYGTPQFDGWFGQYDPSNSFVVNGYYSESNGHVTDAGYWRGGFGVRGSYTLPDSSVMVPLGLLSGEMKYGRESYRAYASRTSFRVHDLSGLEVSAALGSRYALPYKSLTGVDYSAKTGWSIFSANDSGKAQEKEFFLNGSAATQFLATSFRATVDYRISSYTMNLPGLKTGHWFAFRTDGRQLFTPSLQFSFAVQQFLYRGNSGVTNGRFYPNADIRYTFSDQASMYAGFAPVVERNTLSSVIKQNRYINVDAALLPTDTRLHLYMGMEFTPVEEITVTAKVSYKHIDNYPTFYDKDSAKVWEVLYLSGIRSTKFDVSALYRLSQQQNVTAYFSTQSTKQKDSAGVIPYLPAFTIGAVYHHFFEMGLHVETYAEFNASRYSNFVNTHSNAGYIASGVKAELEMFGQFRGFVEINNLLNQRYYVWNGYQERSVFVMFGISYNW
ncbi:MAG: TonB-dependent receptor [Bacteroidota bacterium]